MARTHGLDLFDPDGGFGPTPLQEPARVNRIGLRKNVRGQGLEDDLQFLVGLVERIGHPQEDRVKPGPARVVDPGIDVCGRHGKICLESYLPDVGGGDCLEDRFDPVTWLSELDETKSQVFQTLAWG